MPLLTEKALDDFELANSVSALVRQGNRIAVLRHGYAGEVWFALQQRDIAGSIKDDLPKDIEQLEQLRGKLVALLGEREGSRVYSRQASRWEATRTFIGQLQAGSVDQIQLTLDQIQRAYDDLASVAPRERDRRQASPIPQIGALTIVLSKVRQSVHDYLVATEEELESGRTESKFLDQVYARINSLLNKYAPEAAVNFVAAQDRAASGGAEAIHTR